MSDIKKDVKFLGGLIKPSRKIDDTQVYTMGKVDSRKFYKQQGITADTVSQMAEANNALINASIRLATDKLKKSDKDINRVFTSIYTDLGKFEARISKRPKTIRNPQTGEKTIQRANINVVSVVKALIDKDLINDCKKEISKLAKV